MHLASQVAREICLHARLQHRNILVLYAAFEDERGIHLVLVSSSRRNSESASRLSCMHVQLVQ